MFVLVERFNLKKMEKRIMAKLDDYIASQKASLEALGTAVSGLAGDIGTLGDKIAALQATLAEGSMTDAQDAAMKEVTDQLAAVTQSAADLDAKTPPNVPVEPPPAEPTA